VRRSTQVALFALDLHVLGTPPAFVLSQDQTLQSRDFELATASSDSLELYSASLATHTKVQVLLLKLTARLAVLLGFAIRFSRSELFAAELIPGDG
jgi:hypothetical protein